MGFIDNIVAAVSPKAAYEREVYKIAVEGLRSFDSYDAGSYERNNRNWHAVNESAEITDRYNRDTIRARARDLERNSDIMNSITSAWKRNIIGSGFILQAKTPDVELNKQIEKAWKKWCKKQNCDVTQTQSLNQMLRMAVNRKKIDGGILFIKRYTRDGMIPFKLQMIEVDELDITETAPKHKGNKVVGGIEYNSYNTPVGYFIKQYDINGYNINNPVYVEAKDVIFYFTKKRPSQVREISDMAPTIPRIRDVNEFITTVSVKERILACLAVFIKRMLPTQGINGGLGRETGNANGKRMSYEGKTIAPGMMKELNAGDEIQVVNPAGQSADATSYTKLEQRMISASQGLSYEATSRDMAESTYSSARQNIIEDDLTYQEDIELIKEIIDEIYETFVISLILSGYINIPGFWEHKDEYFEHEWIKEPKPWIDPAKESSANKIALMTGQKTFKQIAAENGRDWKDQIDDMAEVLNYGNEKGIDMGGVVFGIQKKE